MNDFRQIRYGGRRFFNEEHEKCLAFIKEAVEVYMDYIEGSKTYVEVSMELRNFLMGGIFD